MGKITDFIMGNPESYMKEWRNMKPTYPEGVHPPVPDWRTFKVEQAPDLVKFQKELAAYGLKDPWLRNEVWRFDPVQCGSTWGNTKYIVFRGFRLGLILAIVHAGLKKFLSEDDDHH